MTKAVSLGAFKTYKKSPRGIRLRCCPSPRVQNILRSLKIRALTCVEIRRVFVWPNDNGRSGAGDHPKKIQVTRPRPDSGVKINICL